MMLPRFLIAEVMTVVAIVALNIALARALFAYDPEVLIGIALTSLALQFALFRIVMRGRTYRTFWIGFAALGSLAMVLFIWGRILPAEWYAIAYPGRPTRYLNVSRVSAFWLSYGEYMGRCLEPWFANLQIDIRPDGITAAVIRAIVWALPQLLVALVGGLIAWGISKLVKPRFGLLSQSLRRAAT